MAQIMVNNVTFGYEGSFDNVFENISFSIDTDWKIGFIGRNGKGKTTFLNLLMGKYEYTGNINTSTVFDYFPYEVSEKDFDKTADELMDSWKAGVESWRVICELAALNVDAEILYRPFGTLSHGERTKIMLAVLFSGDNDFLLIDEPTNHLDKEAREVIKEYLKSKEGFILVSHDRDLLDACTNHMLIFNRESIEVMSGNFSTWWKQKERADINALAENEKHNKEIKKLRETADRSNRWAIKNEATKIGFDPLKEPERNISTRAYIGAKTKKMQSRVKNYQNRMERSIEQKEGLLKDIEETIDLKLQPLSYHKKRLIECRDFSMKYKDGKEMLFDELTFEVMEGQRVFLCGENGCGKSSLIKAILELNKTGSLSDTNFTTKGELIVPGNLVISYISQDTSMLKGNLKDFAKDNGIDYTLFLSILRQLDFDRKQFQKDMKEFSEGQKKKVLIASGLLKKAHIYIWDEPLNYIDVFSRMQIERVIKDFNPTMILVEHDVRFREEIATDIIEIKLTK